LLLALDYKAQQKEQQINNLLLSNNKKEFKGAQFPTQKNKLHIRAKV
jgi:hypothetical protein